MRVAVIASPYPLEEFPSPPLGIAYVAAAFEAAGCEVRVFDYIISAYSREKLAAQLADFQPDAVGAGSVTMNFYDGQRILRDVKSIDPGILTMMGGPHVSFTVEETLRTYPEIDVIFIGEADDTIVEFAPLIRKKINGPRCGASRIVTAATLSIPTEEISLWTWTAFRCRPAVCCPFPATGRWGIPSA